MNILNTKSKKFQNKITNAPKTPGCYLYKSDNKIIYIGKAKVLQNRVKSYFNNFKRLDEAKSEMIMQVDDVEFIKVDTEFEALVLETNLIKKYKPKYNILMRDGKNYLYVRFEKIRRKNQKPPKKSSSYQDFPRISMTRKKKDDGAEYYGPYPEKLPLKRLLTTFRKVFPHRTSKRLVYVDDYENGKIYTEDKKPCFYYHIGLCKGACMGKQSRDDYLKDFKNIKKFFSGEQKSIINQLNREIKAASKNLEFEKAANLRDKIRDIEYATTNIRIDSTIDDVTIEELQRKQRNEAIDELIEFLDFPPDKLSRHSDFRIECYDISNLGGKNAVGSMVVNINSEHRPDMYRKFKIRMKNEPNDFGMLMEVLSRRFRRFYINNLDDIELENSDIKKRAKNWKEDESFKQRPDLIIIDGGKGQLASTYKILYKLGLHNEIPIVGLAKREEEIFKLSYQFKDEYNNQINDSDKFSRVLLPRKSESLFLVQRIRDEAHRFAITYHRKLRKKQMGI